MSERLRILELIESGQITVSEGLDRLRGLPEKQESESKAKGPEASVGGQVGTEPSSGFTSPAWVPIVWQALFGVGVVGLASGGLLLSRAYAQEGRPGLAWGWLLFVMGLLIMGLGWWARQARWFYLRVREHEGHSFTLALPLPLAGVIWLVRVAQPFVPQLQEVDADAVLVAMRDELREGRPLTIHVDEGGDGDEVEICFI